MKSFDLKLNNRVEKNSARSKIIPPNSQQFRKKNWSWGPKEFKRKVSVKYGEASYHLKKDSDL